MYIHPNSFGYNAADIFPEIFETEGVDFAHFCTALSLKDSLRPSDYFLSGEMLYGSQTNKDISMLFSAIQRLYRTKHRDFADYIRSKKVRSRLLGITDSKKMGAEITNIADEYNEEHGQRHALHAFYTDNLDEASKQQLTRGIAVPAYYFGRVAANTDEAVSQRIDFLLLIRNGLDHAAIYHPLALHPPQPEYITVEKGGKEFTFLVHLTFQELYEITRKAMAAFWLAEYRQFILTDGTRVDTIHSAHRAEIARLNEQRGIGVDT